MHTLTLNQAESQLASLLKEVIHGEEVVITREDGMAFTIVPRTVTKPIPRFGSAKGQVELSDDFDEPLEDFQEYMP